MQIFLLISLGTYFTTTTTTRQYKNEYIGLMLYVLMMNIHHRERDSLLKKLTDSC